MPATLPRPRRSRPRWPLFLLLGGGLSYAVALTHWILVEIDTLPRPVFHQPDDAAGGQALVEMIHVRLTGQRPRDPGSGVDGYVTVAYGWPIANWGTVFRRCRAVTWQLGVDPVVAVDLRTIWPPTSKVDPYAPNAAGSSATAWDGYERYLPVFPLLGHSLLASGFWGGLLAFAWYGAARIGRRQRSGDQPCVACGYDLAGLAARCACPECGATPSIDGHESTRRP